MTSATVDRATLEPTRGVGWRSELSRQGGFELRAKGDGSKIVGFYGHAAVTGHGYEMYGGPNDGGWTEYVDPGAFATTLRSNPDVAFLLNHSGATMARTKPGTLRLAEDRIGLEVDADLNRARPDIDLMVMGIEDGSLDEMSFAFYIVRQMWLNEAGEEVPWWDLDGIERHIQEVNLNKGDVSVVNYGANDAATGQLRQLRAERDDLRTRLAALEARMTTLPVPAPVPETAPPGMSLALARALAGQAA